MAGGLKRFGDLRLEKRQFAGSPDSSISGSSEGLPTGWAPSDDHKEHGRAVLAKQLGST